MSNQEQDLIRLMLSYGAHSIKVEVLNENENEKSTVEYPLAQFIVEEILSDKLSYKNEKYQLVLMSF